MSVSTLVWSWACVCTYPACVQPGHGDLQHVSRWQHEEVHAQVYEGTSMVVCVSRLCVQVCAHAQVYVHAKCTCTGVHVCVCVQTQVCVYMYSCVHVHVKSQVYVCAYTCVCTHVYVGGVI